MVPGAPTEPVDEFSYRLRGNLPVMKGTCTPRDFYPNLQRLQNPPESAANSPQLKDQDLRSGEELARIEHQKVLRGLAMSAGFAGRGPAPQRRLRRSSASAFAD